MRPPGKTIVDEFYVHLSALKDAQDESARLAIERSIGALTVDGDLQPNVAKYNLRTGRVSLLSYPDFFDSPFPALVASWVFAPGATTPSSHRRYDDSLNPPILHRKELMAAPDHPGRDAWLRLTASAEALGLFDDTTTIGFKLNWERLIASKGWHLDGDSFVPLGNDVPTECLDSGPTTGAVQRHLTALTRSNLSAPVQLLLWHGLLPEGTSLFDYGCGRGGDVAGLTANGFAAHGWDPHYAADQPTHEADVVNLGFVVNVIEDPAERVDALQKAFKLARRVMAVGVMLYGSETAGRPFRDGFITSRNTFQKYFSQGEFKDYLEQVLQQEAFMAGPGVAFVFSDKDSEQRFSVGRFRSRGIAARVLATRVPRVRLVRDPKLRPAKPPNPQTPSRADLLLLNARPQLDALWTTTLDLGRLPESDEVANLADIEAQLGGLPKALRLLARHYDQQLLAAAARTRADDVRLYLAMQQFSKRPAYQQLEPRLQRDIKAFFGDYRSAQAAGLRLLLDAADPSQLLAACQRAATDGLGWLENQHSLQLHVSIVERLPVLLRAYVACGLILWDALSEVQLVKIHIASGKLTLMELDDFDTSPLPLLRRRIKVNVRKQDYDVFEYGSAEYPKPLLYRKSRYLHEDYPSYAEQLAFDEALERVHILQERDHGPPLATLANQLGSRRQMISGLRLVPSDTIPELDSRCGANFTYRALIECGETRLRLGLPNLPLRPETYNALHAMATAVLDPVIGYFGSIRLTYGFASAELTKHIARGIAPKLDQHSACDRNSRGELICGRGGAACDFVIDDENMAEVVDWIIENLPFDRLYYYGPNRPIHMSHSATNSHSAFTMSCSISGRLFPMPYDSHAPS